MRKSRRRPWTRTPSCTRQIRISSGLGLCAGSILSRAWAVPAGAGPGVLETRGLNQAQGCCQKPRPARPLTTFPFPFTAQRSRRPPTPVNTGRGRPIQTRNQDHLWRQWRERICGPRQERANTKIAVEWGARATLICSKRVIYARKQNQQIILLGC